MKIEKIINFYREFPASGPLRGTAGQGVFLFYSFFTLIDACGSDIRQEQLR